MCKVKLYWVFEKTNLPHDELVIINPLSSLDNILFLLNYSISHIVEEDISRYIGKSYVYIVLELWKHDKVSFCLKFELR